MPLVFGAVTLGPFFLTAFGELYGLIQSLSGVRNFVVWQKSLVKIEEEILVIESYGCNDGVTPYKGGNVVLADRLSIGSHTDNWGF